MKKEKKLENLRVRAAPSPTGEPHVGNLRTFLYNYLAAKHYGGKFILRIEDTDKKREIKEGIDVLKSLLEEYDMIPDEGPDYGGDFGPYVQSKKKKEYGKLAAELVEKGAAYYCFCSEDRLKKVRDGQKKQGIQTRYDGYCRKIDPEEAKKRVEGGDEHVIRLKVPTTGVCSFYDAAFGKVSVPYKSIDDQVLLKSDGFPTYHFGVVVDDHDMQITHVFRGYDYLSSTPKDILIYEAFDWKVPEWVHMPLIVGSDNKKLGKRSGALPARQYLEEGYLVDAVLNYIALLGWNPGDDMTVMKRKELIKRFTIDRVQKSPAKFDSEKFLWLNGEHIRNLKIEDLEKEFLEWVEKYGKKELYDFLSKDKELSEKLSLIQVRAKTLAEILEQLEFFYKAPEKYEVDVEKMEDKILEELIDMHILVEIESQEEWEKGVREIADKHKLKHGDVFMQLRIAIVGSKFSPPLRESFEILGKEEVLKRLQAYRVS